MTSTMPLSSQMRRTPSRNSGGATTKPPHKARWFTLEYLAYFACLGWALFAGAGVVYDLSKEAPPHMHRHLQAGWLMGGRRVDLADGQYRFFRAELPLLTAAAGGEGETAGRARIALARTGRAPGRALEEALKSPDSAQREAAALALILMFPPPREPAARLFPALNDPEPKVRRAAAAAIGNYAISNPAVLPPDAAARLMAAMDNSDPETRSLAVFPLRHLAASDKKAFAALVSALANKDPAVSVAAADALGAAGPKAAAALPALWKAFAAKDCLPRLAAARAIAAVNPSLRSNPALARALKAGCAAGKARGPGKRAF
jgi:hypothetical protein